MGEKAKVIIIGGGISGVSAAVRLVDNGFDVNIIESRGFLGGRSFSFKDKETGIELDNGQHVITKACSMYLDLAERLGILNQWKQQDNFQLQVYDKFNKLAILKSSILPSPFHLAPSFFNYSHLDISDKISICKALYQAKRTNRDNHGLDELPFGEWLAQNKQSSRAIEFFWDLIIMPILNDRVQDVSTTMALMVIQNGLLKYKHNADIGYPLKNLSHLMSTSAIEYLGSRSASFTLSTTVRSLKSGDGQIKSVELQNGVQLDGQIVISAVPVYNLLKILPYESLSIPYFRRLEGLHNSPIVNIHLWYDQKVMERKFCAFGDSPLQWVFNEDDKDSDLSSIQPRVGIGSQNKIPQHICVSLSAAWEYIDQPKEDLIRQFTTEMSLSFPLARQANIIRALVIKQRNATFRCSPGSGDLRPGSHTPYDNLFLAGDWTNTGWPSTMESAVRSGYNAAHAIIDK